MPEHGFVDVWQFHGRYERAYTGCGAKSRRDTFQNQTRQWGSFKQEGHQEETFDAGFDMALDAELRKVLVGQVQLLVRTNAVNQMRQLQILRHGQVVSDIVVVLIDGA